MQYFFGKINFVRKFVSYFAEIVRPLQSMIKKDVEFKLTNFESDFQLYIFASEHSIVIVLTQKDEGCDCPISFMSTNLQGVQLEYPRMDKKAFVYFRK